MRILIDQAICGAAELFATLGEVHPFDGRALGSAEVRKADALIVRSITRIGETLLAGSNVRFVGTTATGVDHIDTAFLDRAGIQFASAPGCNARPVAEYVLTAILLMADRMGFDPRDKTLGVVGVGRIGSIVARWAATLGMHVLLCDPPRQGATPLPGVLGAPSPLGVGDGPSLLPTPAQQARLVAANHELIADSTEWVSLDELLAGSDLITLHVPLTRQGPDRTQGMVDHRWITAMRREAILLNTARGEVVSEPDLIMALKHEQIGGAVLDVWIGEPVINPELVGRADIATPHIAGGTQEARRRAAAMIFEAMAEWASFREVNNSVNDLVRTFLHDAASPYSIAKRADDERTYTERAGRSSDPDIPHHTPGAPSPLGVGERLTAALQTMRSACDLEKIDKALKRIVAPEQADNAFDDLRSLASQRREFSAQSLDWNRISGSLETFMTMIGFSRQQSV